MTTVSPTPFSAPRQFATTRWSVVLAAGGVGSEARRALGELCEGAWYPLYAFARRTGLAHADAADAVQGFFAELLDRGWVKDADAARGRFRTFLKVAFRRHLGRLREATGALKRGGGVSTLTLAPPDAAARYAREPSHAETPEALYERRWALELLARVLDRLEEEHAGDGRFEVLKPCLTGSAGRSYAEIAAELNLSEAAVKTAVHRLRNRYRELLKAEVAGTVALPSDVADELNALRASL
ncbi:RNA polymerase sigma factor [Alienimonas californiensis]|uniref:Sigma-70, region 4 n=1 Tax=Alienimonas californiensis TaxID=2527989 RepID=A0A517P569_9PLAN|nr:sigma-70 family RNA polymerase sigma factor [Alienimonas californiensis]QDT14519.1 Sigma-70, region 4 [Alienimonas californiensis]